MQSGGVDELKCADIDIDANVGTREPDQLALDRRRGAQVKFAAYGNGRGAVGVRDHGGGGSAIDGPRPYACANLDAEFLWRLVASLAVVVRARAALVHGVIDLVALAERLG